MILALVLCFIGSPDLSFSIDFNESACTAVLSHTSCCLIHVRFHPGVQIEQAK